MTKPVPLEGDAPIDVPEQFVVGRALVHEVSPRLPTSEVLVNAVYFDPGSRFRPHRHRYDQVLFYESGTGVVALDGGEDIIVPIGQFVVLPANTVHMHGCTDDGPAMHLSIMVNTETDFEVDVPDRWAQWKA